MIYPSAHRILEGMDQQGWCDGSWQRIIDGSVSFAMDQGVGSNIMDSTVSNGKNVS